MTPAPPRQLHVAAIGAEALSGLSGTALPLLVVGLLGNGVSVEALLYGAVGVLISVGIAVVQWTSTRWYLTGDEIRLRTGVFSESVTSVPYDRVQAVDTVRGPVQRLLGAVELHVQSAGGGRRAEIVLRAVSPAEADELRTVIRDFGTTPGGFGKSPGPFPERPDFGPGSDPLTHFGPGSDPRTSLEPAAAWRLGTRPLLAAAATSASLGVLVPVVAFASQTAEEMFGIDDAERLVPGSVGEAALVVGAVLAVAWVLSFLGTIVAFAGFTARREGDRLRITRGVVERREASVPVRRVHAVRVVESPLRQPFGLAQVRIETAGYAQERATAQTLLPLVRRGEAAALIRELLPELDAPLDELAPMPARAARRYVLPPALGALVPAAAAAIVLGTPGLAAFVLVPLGAAAGLAAYRTAGVGLHGDRVVVRGRTRTLARTTATADARRLQAVRTSATPFQERARLATLGFDVSSGRELRIRHVDATDAEAHLDRLAQAATAEG